MRTRGGSTNSQQLWLSGHFLIVGNEAEGKNQMEHSTIQGNDNGPLKRMRSALRRDRTGHRESGPAETGNSIFAKRIAGFKDFDVKTGIFERNPSLELDSMTKDLRGK
jgi:hypothetical protein